MEDRIIAKDLEKTYRIKDKNRLFSKAKYKEVRAVHGISLELPKGKIIGLLGINGAGKTTTIRMLSSIIEPSSGTLFMNGIDAIKYHMKVKEKINVISGGERNLYWRLTAKENLKYFGSLYGIKKDILEKRIEKLLRLVELEDVENTPVERYSKGMKQRLQIARGLINNPEYIFLDEPTLGLDIMIAKELRKTIASLAKEQERGILLTTHYISEAEELCDYIYVIDKGSIIAKGTKEDLKELFKCKQEAKITIDQCSTSCEIQIKEAAKRMGEEAEFKTENNKINIKISGSAAVWSMALDILARNNVAVLDMNVYEPKLEDILIYLINNSRMMDKRGDEVCEISC